MDESFVKEVSNQVASSLWGAIPNILAMLILVYITYCYIQSIYTFNLNKFKELTYPLIIALLLLSGTHIYSVLDTLLYPTVYATESFRAIGLQERENLVNEKNKILEQKIKEKAANEQKEKTDESFLDKINFIKRGIDWVIEGAEEIYSFLKNLPIYFEMFGGIIVTLLLELLYLIVFKIITFLSVFSRIIIASLSPIVLVMSIIPEYRQLLPNLIKRYITFFLYIPILNILSAVINQVSIYFLKADIVELQNIDPIEVETYSSTVYISFLILGLISFAFVPTVSGWFLSISMSGLNTFHQKMQNLLNSFLMNTKTSRGLRTDINMYLSAVKRYGLVEVTRKELDRVGKKSTDNVLLESKTAIKNCSASISKYEFSQTYKTKYTNREEQSIMILQNKLSNSLKHFDYITQENLSIDKENISFTNDELRKCAIFLKTKTIESYLKQLENSDLSYKKHKELLEYTINSLNKTYKIQ